MARNHPREAPLGNLSSIPPQGRHLDDHWVKRHLLSLCTSPGLDDLHVGVTGKLEPAWHVSDKSHIACGSDSAHSLYCEMFSLIHCPPSLFFLSFVLFFCGTEGYFWNLNSSPLSGTIVFVVWFL